MRNAAVENITSAVISRAAVILLLLLTTSCSYTSTNLALHGPAAGVQNRVARNISAHELHRLLTDHFGTIFIKLSDAKYALPDNEQVAKLSRVQGKEEWDPSDYAIAAMVPLRNYAFGAMYTSADNGRREVLNIFVNSKREIVYWQAQNGASYRGIINKPELIVF